MKTASSLPARATAILNNKTAKHIDILDSKAFKLPSLLPQRILYALFPAMPVALHGKNPVRNRFGCTQNCKASQ